jgi:predicted metal-dependent hydrolase
MAIKIIEIEGIGTVQIAKRRTQKVIRLTIRGSIVKVTQPSWLPYSAGITFVKSRKEWISEHLKAESMHEQGASILGRTLEFARSTNTNLSSRVTNTTVLIRLPEGYYPEDAAVQEYINRKLTSLARDEGERFLPARVAQLADMFGFTYKSVQIRQLKSRWGSCNSHKELVFNLNLIKLDPLHIDYVILHELTHTIHMNHGPEFWSHLESVYPDAKKIAKVVRRISL